MQDLSPSRELKDEAHVLYRLNEVIAGYDRIVQLLE